MDRKPTKKRKLVASNAANTDSVEDAKQEEDSPLSLDSLDDSVDLPEFVKEHQHTLTFPDKLMLMLIHIDRDCKKAGRNVEDECIGWDASGKAIVVRDQKKLCDNWLPLFFGQAKYSSFTRKLYRWEFRKHHVADQSATPGWVYFQNDNFQRDQVDLRRNMKSVTAIKLRNEAAAVRAVRNEAGRNSERGQSLPIGSEVASMDQFPIAPGSTGATGTTQMSQNTNFGFPWNVGAGQATSLLRQPFTGVSPLAPARLSGSDSASLQSLLSLLGSQQNPSQQVLLSSSPLHTFPSANSSSHQQACGPLQQQDNQSTDSSVQAILSSLLGQISGTMNGSTTSAHPVQGQFTASSQPNPAAEIVQLLLLQQLQLRQSSSTSTPVIPQGFLSVNQAPTANSQSQVHNQAPAVGQSNLLSLLAQLGSSSVGGLAHRNQTPTPTASAMQQNEPQQQLSPETIAFIMNLLAQLNSGHSSSQSNSEGRR